MKIATIVVRLLLGGMFVFFSVLVLFKLGPEPTPEGDLGTFFEGMKASGYLLTLVKVTELVCGIAFLVGRFVPLATVVIFPVSLNILLTHLFVAPEGMPIAIFVMGANLFLAFRYKDHYRPLLQVR